MPCVNHPEREIQSYCQNCGKGLCTDCVRRTANGQVLCEPCFTLLGGDPSRAYWQQAASQFVVPTPPGTPNPSAAAVLGLIPGVGAMYNGQFFKGLIHVVVFAVLISITEHAGVFGIFIGAWVLYQSFEAYHTAKARRDGLPLPDPFGLNELGSWLNLGQRGPSIHPGQGVPPPGDPAAPNAPGAAPGTGAPGGGYTGAAYTPGAAYTAGTAYTPGEPYNPATAAPPYSAPYQGQWQQYPPPAQPPYTEPFAGGEYPGGPPPPPPAPPMGWRRKEPVWAFVLIGLGVIFLLQSLGVVGHIFHFAWPVLLIGLGVWMIVSRTQGGSK